MITPPTVPDYWLKQAAAVAVIHMAVSINPQRTVVCYDPLHNRFVMYREDAWTKPEAQGFLPWEPPPSRLVRCVVVAADGTVTRC